jgi:hypothetical protein
MRNAITVACEPGFLQTLSGTWATASHTTAQGNVIETRPPLMDVRENPLFRGVLSGCQDDLKKVHAFIVRSSVIAASGISDSLRNNGGFVHANQVLQGPGSMAADSLPKDKRPVRTGNSG